MPIVYFLPALVPLLLGCAYAYGTYVFAILVGITMACIAIPGMVPSRLRGELWALLVALVTWYSSDLSHLLHLQGIGSWNWLYDIGSVTYHWALSVYSAIFDWFLHEIGELWDITPTLLVPVFLIGAIVAFGVMANCCLGASGALVLVVLMVLIPLVLLVAVMLVAGLYVLVLTFLTGEGLILSVLTELQETTTTAPEHYHTTGEPKYHAQFYGDDEHDEPDLESCYEPSATEVKYLELLQARMLLGLPPHGLVTSEMVLIAYMRMVQQYGPQPWLDKARTLWLSHLTGDDSTSGNERQEQKQESASSSMGAEAVLRADACAQLGLVATVTLTSEMVKAAYRKAANLNHPDKCLAGDQEFQTAKMQSINQARNYLMQLVGD